MKFQEPSMHGSKVMLCTQKHDKFLQRGITQERGITLTKNTLQLFFHEEFIYEISKT